MTRYVPPSQLSIDLHIWLSTGNQECNEWARNWKYPYWPVVGRSRRDLCAKVVAGGQQLVPTTWFRNQNRCLIEMYYIMLLISMNVVDTFTYKWLASAKKCHHPLFLLDFCTIYRLLIDHSQLPDCRCYEGFQLKAVLSAMLYVFLCHEVPARQNPRGSVPRHALVACLVVGHRLVISASGLSWPLLSPRALKESTIAIQMFFVAETSENRDLLSL